MGQILAYIVFGGTGVIALFLPWIGVIAGYVMVVLSPHVIWWWAFEGFRPFLYVAIPVLIGCALACVTGRVDVTRLQSKISIWLFIWWLSLFVSVLFGEYVDAIGPGPRWHDPSSVLESMSKTFIFLFVGVICITDDRKFRYLTYVMLASIVYYIYWSHDQYFNALYFGRLSGPRTLTATGPYTDENQFGMLFVVGLPFIYYYGLYLKQWFWRCAVWGLIPLGWHVIFLTGSRGAMVGLLVTLVVFFLRSKRKGLALAALPLFATAYFWQAGDLMKYRFESVNEYQDDTSAAGRLAAWSAALGMIAEHPITGVGPASFGVAFPDYNQEMTPREAHNTYLQVTAESGLPAGLAFIAIFVGSFLACVKRPRRDLQQISDPDERYVYAMGEACIPALAGFLVCALFLSLHGLEVIFYLVLLVNYIVSREKSSEVALALQRANGPIAPGGSQRHGG